VERTNGRRQSVGRDQLSIEVRKELGGRDY
jgi:hypothetical protein